MAGPGRLVHSQRIPDPQCHMSSQRWHHGGQFQLRCRLQACNLADRGRLFGMLVLLEHDRLAGSGRFMHGKRIANPHRHLSSQRWHHGRGFELLWHQAGKYADCRRLFGLFVQLAGQRIRRLEQHVHQQRNPHPDRHLSPQRWYDSVGQQLQCRNETCNQRDLGCLFGLLIRLDQRRMAGPGSLVYCKRNADAKRDLSSQRWHHRIQFQLRFGQQARNLADGRGLFRLLLRLGRRRLRCLEQHLLVQRHPHANGYLSSRRWHDRVQFSL